jgi:hypothetical protein
MRKLISAFGLILGIAIAALGAQADAASVIAKCAEAMGGAAAVKNVKNLRAEVVYPDHDAAAVLQEIRRPNMIRTERPGDYTSVFDGKIAGMLKYDKADPAKPPVSTPLPAEAGRGFETDLIWLFPAFFDYPAEYGGLVDANGTKCHKLTVAMPLGTKAVYLVDAATFLVRTIAVDETYQGRTFHMEREWMDLRPVQGILFPGRMSYPARGGKTAIAEIRKIEFNVALADDRFRLPPGE